MRGGRYNRAGVSRRLYRLGVRRSKQHAGLAAAACSLIRFDAAGSELMAVVLGRSIVPSASTSPSSGKAQRGSAPAPRLIPPCAKECQTCTSNFDLTLTG